MITKRKKILRWALLLLWMTVIFMMSQQTGDKSSSQSDFVVNLVSFIGIEFNDYVMGIATFLVRKSAHFMEYMILFILAYRLMILDMNKRQAKIVAVVVVFGYACSDEFHQYFINGREAAFRDVMIDTSGGIIGSLLMMVWEKKKKST
jgi:VanZ family protein